MHQVEMVAQRGGAVLIQQHVPTRSIVDWDGARRSRFAQMFSSCSHRGVSKVLPHKAFARRFGYGTGSCHGGRRRGLGRISRRHLNKMECAKKAHSSPPGLVTDPRALRKSISQKIDFRISISSSIFRFSKKKFRVVLFDFRVINSIFE
jgi:hypothetical protein